jgi:hypothetical protein
LIEKVAESRLEKQQVEESLLVPKSFRKNLMKELSSEWSISGKENRAKKS